MLSNDSDSVELFPRSKPEVSSENNRTTMKIKLSVVVMFVAAFFCAGATRGQVYVPTNDPPHYGPYNGVFWAGGDELKKHLAKNDTVLRADSPWSLYAWIWMDETPKGAVLIAGVGDLGEEYSRYLGVDGEKLFYWGGKDATFSGTAGLGPGKWQFVAATFDGQEVQIYASGSKVARGKVDAGRVSPLLVIAPVQFPAQENRHFAGKIAGLTVLRRVLSGEELKEMQEKPVNFATAVYEEGSKPWPVQTQAQSGYRAPQDPDTMPRAKATYSPLEKKALRESKSGIEAKSSNEWNISGRWKLRPAPEVSASGEAISQNGFLTNGWWDATVPGTVLTTMINQGVYPDPDYGLNNMAIPETLNKQDYWYRSEFTAPADWKGQRLTVTFEGINYAAEIWLNGKRMGTIKGAFIRGVFDVTNEMKTGGANVLGVRVSPPPHPGIPHEQSIKAGPGENGGLMCLDGPTFVDTEGWDWIPSIRDRDTGIWQPVTVRATGGVKIGDGQVVTKLPLPETSSADVEITVPLDNETGAAISGTLEASFDNVKATKTVSLAPGKTSVTLTPSEFAQLKVQHPRLWWPNGYGKPELYTLKLVVTVDGKKSDAKEVRFGIRELTYELSLLDGTGHLERVEFSPTTARAKQEQIVDVTHTGIRNVPSPDPFPSIFPEEWRDGWKSWVASLKPGAEKSAAVKQLEDTRATPYLAIKVNGVRIAVRGGSWGMDDMLKRVSRERLEPYFRLHRDANVNIIRNWVGQSTEEVFYDLADEYGLLVWNDFWASTQNYNIEPEDPALFLENARDTISRFRNHPSIAVWCGRNEGVPQPILNQGLEELTRTVDGTRYYTPTSNQVNLQNSGPYKYVEPKLYFTMLNHGFSVETGTPSFPTLENWRAWIPREDLWPISDNWAYHDWHQSANGDMTPFMAEMEKEFGAPTSLEDFERKAQMFNYVQHRAVFEGMNAHLWAPNTGRMLWMTQPAWPSSTWQILSSDYDTQASFYAVKKASEAVHVQLDPSNYAMEVANSLPDTKTALTARARVYSLENKLLAEHQEKKDAASGTTEFFTLDLAPFLKQNVALVKLELRDSGGKLVSDNFYWMGGTSADYRKLNRLGEAQIKTTVRAAGDGEEQRVKVVLENTGSTAAIELKLTLLGADGKTRVLPAYYSDNYFSLLPGEKKEIIVEYPKAAAKEGVSVALRGWNLEQRVVRAGTEK
jgi:Exo-beta-D-glucosaminidase Ig-fold domain/Glycosyl hydrolases family 2/Concanavalin A-like lectin/glucanases superfamily/Glycosyl hydrolases family 2, sugar binding domain/Glycosyl hydrolases family 2, TIM barrel domain